MATKEKNMLIDEGPYKWLIPVIESSYSRIISRAQSKNEETETIEIKAAVEEIKNAKKSKEFTIGSISSVSRLQPGRSDEVLSDVSLEYWKHILKEYQHRKGNAARQIGLPQTTIARAMPGMPAIQGTNNRVPIGPAVVAHGQAVGDPPVGGRVGRMAITANSNRIYVATANGGVSRSDYGGDSGTRLWMGSILIRIILQIQAQPAVQ